MKRQLDLAEQGQPLRGRLAKERQRFRDAGTDDDRLASLQDPLAVAAQLNFLDARVKQTAGNLAQLLSLARLRDPDAASQPLEEPRGGQSALAQTQHRHPATPPTHPESIDGIHECESALNPRAASTNPMIQKRTTSLDSATPPSWK